MLVDVFPNEPMALANILVNAYELHIKLIGKLPR